jgi:hypothetical protein
MIWGIQGEYYSYSKPNIQNLKEKEKELKSEERRLKYELKQAKKMTK